MTITDLLELAEGPYSAQGWAPGWQDLTLEPDPHLADAVDEARDLGGPPTRVVSRSGHTVWRSPPRPGDFAP